MTPIWETLWANAESICSESDDKPLALKAVLACGPPLMCLGLLEILGRIGRPVTAPLQFMLACGRSLGKKLHALEVQRSRRLDELFPSSREESDDDTVLQVSGGEHSVTVPLLSYSTLRAGVQTATVIAWFSGSLPAKDKATLYDLVTRVGIDFSEGAARGDLRGVTRFMRSNTNMLQADMELNGGILNTLNGVLSEVAALDKTCTLQIASWGVLLVSEEEIQLVKLSVRRVPAIYHAEYAAGLLTVTGLNLEGADVLISSSTSTIKIEPWRFQKLDGRVCYGLRFRRRSDIVQEVVSFRIWLEGDVRKFSLLATKNSRDIGVGGKPIQVWSKAVHIHDSFWETALRLWLPAVGLWFILIKYLISCELLTNRLPAFYHNIWTAIVLECGIVLPIVMPSYIKLLPTCFVEFVKYRAETVFGGLGRGLLAVYYAFRRLGELHVRT